MLVCLDVAYRPGRAGEEAGEDAAVAAAVAADRWTSDAPTHEATTRIERVEPYVPGQLFRRELPCLLAVLDRLAAQTGVRPTVVVVDGFVWLGGPPEDGASNDEQARRGLGAHLHHALGGTVPVVGVAKNPYAHAGPVREILRGTSRRPLYVSAVGLPLDDAAHHVATMHGRHRLPTLLRHVDHLCRHPPIDRSVP